jgi:hypothetical protein
MNIDSSLIVGGITVNLYARLDWTQTYTVIGGRSTRRLQNGTAIRQTHWTKLKTQVSAQGVIPPGLDGLDYGQPQTLACAAPRSMAQATRVFALPAARRTDTGYTPRGWAYVYDEWIETAVGIVVNTATLDAVANASQYRIVWYPYITAYIDPPEEETDIMADDYRWTLTAEEQ